MHTLSPENDNCPSCISGRERMTVENISWSISTKEYCRPRRVLSLVPSILWWWPFQYIFFSVVLFFGTCVLICIHNRKLKTSHTNFEIYTILTICIMIIPVDPCCHYMSRNVITHTFFWHVLTKNKITRKRHNHKARPSRCTKIRRDGYKPWQKKKRKKKERKTSHMKTPTHKDEQQKRNCSQ